jgi:hypothetical protein
MTIELATKLKIQELESAEDIGALMEGDIVPVRFEAGLTCIRETCEYYDGLALVVNLSENLPFKHNSWIGFARRDGEKIVVYSSLKKPEMFEIRNKKITEKGINHHISIWDKGCDDYLYYTFNEKLTEAGL